MAYRKINYSPEYLERRKAYQKEYARAKRRTPEGMAAAKEAWKRFSDKLPPDELKRQSRVNTFRYRAKKLGINPDVALFLIDCGCQICGKQNVSSKKQRTLVLDHNHKTGKFRGILCMGCNTSIGQFGDDPRMLERAAKYLRGEL